MISLIGFLLVSLLLAYHGVRLWISTLVLTLTLLFVWLMVGPSLALVTGSLLFAFMAVIVNTISLRQKLISNIVFTLFQAKTPKISKTERIVLEAGNVWWEKELFCGNPDWNKLLRMPKPELSVVEQSFLDIQVEALCQKIDEQESELDHFGLTPDILSYLKQEKFFGMVIHKSYGGLGFSAQAHSAVIKKIASRSMTMAIIVMVPNSLGPGELISSYGTTEQKQKYLPRLAAGEEIPCFGLTAAHAGSDATSITDSGVLVRNEEGVLGIQLNFEKRYITLAPIATLLGLAFKLYDPDHLLGSEENLGINIAMIPLPLKGIDNHRRHWPMQLSFPNGPVKGHDVFIPMDYLLGGQAMIGRGWEFLVERLSIGRAISLPAVSCAGASVAYLTAGAYAHVRKQFHLPIAEFEGVKDSLAEIAGFTYLLEATRLLTASAIDQNISPTLASAIAKYHMTEMERKIINHAMDIHAGKAVQAGPKNYLLEAYLGIPIGITVEGANILTRCLIIFGQGALRCHPYLIQEIAATQNPDVTKGLKEFDHLFWSHVGYVLRNKIRTWVMGLTGGHLIRTIDSGPLAKYYRALTRMSAALSYLSEVAITVLGAKLKVRESLSARLGDVLSQLYLASAVLKYYNDQGRQASQMPYVEWCLQRCLANIQIAIDGFIDNFPNRYLRGALRFVVFPWGRAYKQPSDKLSHELLVSMTSCSALRSSLAAQCYRGDSNSPCFSVEEAFKASQGALAIRGKIKKALKNKVITAESEALSAGVITSEEEAMLTAADALIEKAIQVDEFNLALDKVMNA